MHYGLKGDNLLYEEPTSDGKTLASVGNWFMTGGYQLDIGPETGHIPEHLKGLGDMRAAGSCVEAVAPSGHVSAEVSGDERELGAGISRDDP